MKEHVQKTGVRKYAGDDLIELQAEPLRVIQAFFEKCGNCVINGCEVVAAGNKYNVTPGVVSLSGTDADGAQAAKVVPFGGVENVTLPIYLTLTNTVSERVYGDGKVKPIAYNYTATATNVHPEEGITFLEITTTGGKQFVDAIKVTEKLDKVGNGKDVTVTFAEAAERVNITSGEKLSGMFSKVQKWFAGLKTVAFTGKAADLEQDANNRLVTDTEKTAWADKYTKAQTYTRTEVDNKDAAALQAAKEYAAAKVAEIVNSAPGTLDTLQELAKALGNDPNFATSITALIGGKADRVHGHAISEVSNLQNELDGKFDKTGGTITGELKINKTADELIALDVKNSQYNNSAGKSTSIVLRSAVSERYGKIRAVMGNTGEFNRFELTCGNTDGKNTTEKIILSIRDGDIALGDKTIWHAGNFNPTLKANVNHGHSVMYSEDIFVGGSRNFWYPVRVPIRGEGVNRFVIRRSIHEDSPNQGSLRAEFITTQSDWGQYVNFIKCINLTASNHGYIAKCKSDYGANMTSCVVWLRGSLTYYIDYYYVPNSSAQVLLETTNIGSPTYPEIVSPTTEVAAEFAGGDIYPVTSTQLNGKLDATKKLTTQDLNTVLTPGLYYQVLNTNATKVLHYPIDGEAGTLIVTAAAANGEYVNQIFTGYMSNRIFIRNSVGSTSLGRDWVELVNVDQLVKHTETYEPAFKKNGAFNKNFGTAAGTVAQGNHTHRQITLCTGKVLSGGNPYFITDGFTISKTAKGVYRIRHNIGHTNYGFVGTGYDTTTERASFIGMRNCTSNYCDIYSYWGSDGFHDSEFSFIIFGWL